MSGWHSSLWDSPLRQINDSYASNIADLSTRSGYNGFEDTSVTTYSQIMKSEKASNDIHFQDAVKKGCLKDVKRYCTDKNINKKWIISGDNPLYVAVEKGHVEVVDFLLKRGASVKFSNSNYNKPLHAAAKEGFVEIAKLLIQYGASKTAQNRQGETPLHVACKLGNLEMVQLVHDSTAQCICNQVSQTPIEVAMVMNTKLAIRCPDALPRKFGEMIPNPFLGKMNEIIKFLFHKTHHVSDGACVCRYADEEVFTTSWYGDKTSICSVCHKHFCESNASTPDCVPCDCKTDVAFCATCKKMCVSLTFNKRSGSLECDACFNASETASMEKYYESASVSSSSSSSSSTSSRKRDPPSKPIKKKKKNDRKQKRY